MMLRCRDWRHAETLMSQLRTLDKLPVESSVVSAAHYRQYRQPEGLDQFIDLLA